MQLKQMIRSNRRNYDVICTELINFVPILAGQRHEAATNILDQREFDIIIDGNWINEAIEGMVEERWPRKNYRFTGIYKNQARNGYGEEYIYDRRIAKGFYSNGKMMLEG